MAIAPSGTQWEITRGEQTATIVEAGGTLRSYRVADQDVLAGFPEHEPCSAGRGQLLLPWPNRIRDGRYTIDGVAQQLAITEPALGNASHGLVRWQPWQRIEQEQAALTVGTRVPVQPGWPSTLDVTMRYELGEDGLTITIEARNVGSKRVPFGCGAHPYVAIGEVPCSEVELQLPAHVHMLVDADRKLPAGIEPVDADELDFRRARALGDVSIDNAFGELDRDPDGRWRVTVAATGRDPVTVWGDAAFRWVQVFTGKAHPGATADGTRGIAIEPLTCPPDAFNSGIDLLMLEPGDHWHGAWGMRIGATRGDAVSRG